MRDLAPKLIWLKNPSLPSVPEVNPIPIPHLTVAGWVLVYDLDLWDISMRELYLFRWVLEEEENNNNMGVSAIPSHITQLGSDRSLTRRVRHPRP